MHPLQLNTLLLLSFVFFSGRSEGFVLKTQVDLPEPKVAELDQFRELHPKLVKALYEVTFVVDNRVNLLDSGYHMARSAPPNIENRLFSNMKPTLVKVEAVTESLVKKGDDDVPVIKGYDPDQTKHLAEALDEIKKQTDLKVTAEPQNKMPGRESWSTGWRPVSRSGDRTPYFTDQYLPPPPCCPDPPRPQWHI